MHVQAVFIPFIFVRMEEKGKILIIDDNKDVLFALNLLLEPYMQKVKVTTQPARIEYFMRTFQPDVVLLDMNFHRDAVSGQEGFEYLGQILEIDPQAVVIFMTAYSDIEKAVKAIKVGATDFISKPWETEKLLATLSSGIRLSHSRKEVGRLREQMKAMKEDDTYEVEHGLDARHPRVSARGAHQPQVAPQRDHLLHGVRLLRTLRIAHQPRRSRVRQGFPVRQDAGR